MSRLPSVTSPVFTPSPPIVTPLNYDDLFRLFSHRHTTGLYKRQAAAFRQIAREKEGGFTMGDLIPVCRLISLGFDRLDQLLPNGHTPRLFLLPLCQIFT